MRGCGRRSGPRWSLSHQYIGEGVWHISEGVWFGWSLPHPYVSEGVWHISERGCGVGGECIGEGCGVSAHQYIDERGVVWVESATSVCR